MKEGEKGFSVRRYFVHYLVITKGEMGERTCDFPMDFPAKIPECGVGMRGR